MNVGFDTLDRGIPLPIAPVIVQTNEEIQRRHALCTKVMQAMDKAAVFTSTIIVND